MHALQVVVFALGIGSTHVDARQLIAAFEAICNDHQANKRRLQYGTTASVKQEQDALPDLDNPASSFDVSSVVRNAESTVGNSAFDCSGDASSSGSSSSGSSSSGSIGSSGDSSNAKYGSNNQLLHNSSSPEQQDHDMQSVVLRQRLSPRQAYFAATTR